MQISFATRLNQRVLVIGNHLVDASRFGDRLPFPLFLGISLPADQLAGIGEMVDCHRIPESVGLLGCAVLFRSTTSPSFPHSRYLPEVLGATLSGCLAANLAGSGRDKTVWNGLAAVRTFQHSRNTTAKPCRTVNSFPLTNSKACCIM